MGAYSVEKGFVIDHKLENTDAEVHLDIVFRRMPCHLLGLDVVDYIGTHSMNLHEKIKKFSVDMDGRTVREMPYEYPEKGMLKDFKKSLKEKLGCRMKGAFSILLVPGNFHIGFHSFGQHLTKILNSDIQFEPNFEHHIEHLSFGTEHSRSEWSNYQSQYQLKELNTLEGYDSNRMTPNPGPFSYHYKLLIAPTNLITASKSKVQVYQYRSFWNLAYMENGFNYLASFDYELSSIVMEHSLTRKTKTELMIHLSGIIGGIVSAMTLTHIVLQKTVMKLLYKDSLGKLS